MSTWHQDKAKTQLWHATEWTVVIDPPHQLRAIYRTSSKALADVYLRGLRENNPGAAAHAYILPPQKEA
jgi:hypothetical protein